MKAIRKSHFSRGKATAIVLIVVAVAASLGLLSLLLVPTESGAPGKVDEARIAPNHSAPALFVEAKNTGVDFVHQTARPGTYFFPEIVGSGVALFDYDRDDDLDLYCVNLGDDYQQGGNKTHRQPSMGNRFYEQIEVGRFVDMTRQSGLGDLGVGMGVAVGDVNNDGFCDIYLTNFGKDRLYLNRGDKTFVDVTAAAGIDNDSWGTSACMLDFDRDGWLDLYVANYVDHRPRPCTQIAGGGQDYCAPHQFAASADKLFRNVTGQTRSNGNSASRPAVRFDDVSDTAGIGSLRGPGLGVTSADFNGDFWPDIYVANDQAPNYLWINQQDGHFRDEAVLVGCAANASGVSQASMGIAIGDLNHDMRPDLFLTHLQGEHHTLYLSEMPAFFRDMSKQAGLQAVNQYTGFGTALVDLEHDGDLDILVVNGAVRRSASRNELPTDGAVYDLPLAEFWKTYAEPNSILINDGSGRFRSKQQVSNETFLTRSAVSRGLATGDLDNDGDVDFVVSNTGGKTRVFLNNASKEGSWVKVRAVEPQLGGRDAYGATVVVSAGRRRWLSVIQPASSYLSSHDSQAHFGLGDVERIDHFEVFWNDGLLETFPGGPVNQPYVLRRDR